MKTIEAAPEHVAMTPLDDARTQLREAIEVLGYDDSMYDLLAQARREVTVSIPLRRDDGSVEVLTAHRVQHSLSCGLMRRLPGKRPTAGHVRPWLAGTYLSYDDAAHADDHAELAGVVPAHVTYVRDAVAHLSAFLAHELVGPQGGISMEGIE